MQYFNYTAYDHYRDDKSNSEPIAPTDEQIVGLELEIANVNNYAGFNEAIEDGILSCPGYEGEGIQLEYEAQSDVEFECVFNADYIENVLDRVKELNGYISGDYSNHHECSAHVHVSREWLEDVRGISEIEYYRAAEAIAPLIYSISGRNRTAWDRWTPSNVEIAQPLLRRFDKIDKAVPLTQEHRPGCSEDRYELCNCTNDNTLEIRGFSNYYDGNIKQIKAFLKVAAELIPDIAEAMQGKTYKHDYLIALKTTEAFIHENQELLNNFNLRCWTDYREEVERHKARQYTALINQYQETERHLNTAINYLEVGEKYNAARHVLEALKSNEYLSVPSIELENMKPFIYRIMDQNRKSFKNAVWRL